VWYEGLSAVDRGAGAKESGTAGGSLDFLLKMRRNSEGERRAFSIILTRGGLLDVRIGGI